MKQEPSQETKDYIQAKYGKDVSTTEQQPKGKQPEIQITIEDIETYMKNKYKK